MTVACPNCGRLDRQVKAGMASGVQRYKCVPCGRRYSIDARPREYAQDVRDRAMELHAAGKSNRQIARELSLSVQTVCNWLLSAPPADGPEPEASEPRVKARVTIADVARHAGVSTSTVSNHLNDKGRMSQETRQRIEESMKALYFTPNALVRSIRNRRTHTIGLVSYGIYELDKNTDYSVVAPMLGAINGAADHIGHNVLLYTGWPHRPRSRTGLDFLNGQIDGLLWVSPPPYHPQLRFAVAAGLPVISLLSRRVPAGVGYVVADNVGGIRDMVTYLAGKGHRRIAFLGSTEVSDFVDRATGYREGLAAADLPYDPVLESTEMRVEWERGSASAVLDRWLRLPAGPTAVVTAEDGLASLAIELIRARGLRVPEDVAVTGFNDLPSAAHLQGGITTVHQPLRDIGRIAVERLYAMIEGAPVSDCRVTVPVTLVARASTEG